MNPEFQRYLWTEFSPQRLVVMPLALGAMFALSLLVGSGKLSTLADTALSLFALLMFFWATRRAAESVITELREGTWDAQRMSAQSAFSMSWGKLLGATVYPWYGALICLTAYLFVAFAPDATEWLRWQSRLLPDQDNMPMTAVMMVVVALTGQVTALACAMALVRKRRTERGVSVTVCHFAGFLVSILLFWPVFGTPHFADVVDWFGLRIDGNLFKLTSAVAFLFWGLLAVLRLMRAELLYRVGSWAWAAFAAFIAIWGLGLADHWLANSGAWIVPRLALPFAIIMSLAYSAFLLEAKDPVQLRGWLRDIAALRLARAAREAPPWAQLFVISLALAVAIVIATPFEAGGVSVLGHAVAGAPIIAVAAMLFLLRDLTLLLSVNLSANPRRGDGAGVIYLMLLYVPAPMLARALGGDATVAIFLPTVTADWQVGLLAPALQAVLVIAFLSWRLSRRPRPAPSGGRS